MPGGKRLRSASRLERESKFLLHYRKDGRDVWRSPSGLRGTFGWKKLEISFLVPEGATGGKLRLGLEESSGKG